MKIGLISDTHGFLDKKVFHYFEECHEIWHAGDIGTTSVADQLEQFKPLRAVFGNIDDKSLQTKYPEQQRFEIEGMDVWMIHIGGSPPRYNRNVISELKNNPPNVFVCGHSHILRIQSDKELDGMIYLNPGAAGRQGLHKIRTLLRFEIERGRLQNLQAIELGKRGT